MSRRASRSGSPLSADPDTIALLEDAVTSPGRPRPPVRVEASNAGSGRRARPVVVTPTPSKKKGSRDGRDPMLSDYLSSLGRIPLLTAEDEVAFARALLDAEVGCWRALLSIRCVAAQLRESPLLVDGGFAHFDIVDRIARGTATPQEIETVACAMRDADDDRALVDEAIAVAIGSGKKRALDESRAHRRRALDIRNRFVRANLRLVVSVARRFHHYRLPLIDLIQEGNLGLIKSVHRFDHTKGFRFSTYAHWWIRQAIERAIMNKGAQVRLPVHMFDARRELAKATRDLQVQLGRDPSSDEIAVAMGVTRDKLEEILRAVPREPISLDDPVGDEEDRTLGEVVCDEESALPDERVIQLTEKHWVRRVLMRLSPMEVDILVRRFGIDTDEDETLEAIGASYNLSRERVRQIQVASLKKMERYVDARREPAHSARFPMKVS